MLKSGPSRWSDCGRNETLRPQSEKPFFSDLALGKELFHFRFGEEADFVQPGLGHGFGWLACPSPEAEPWEEVQLPGFGEPMQSDGEKVGFDEKLAGGSLDPEATGMSGDAECFAGERLLIFPRMQGFDYTIREDDIKCSG